MHWEPVMNPEFTPPIDTTTSNLIAQATDIIDGVPQIDFDAYATLKLLDQTERLVRCVGQSTGSLFDIKAKTVRGVTLYAIKATTLGQQLIDVILKDQVHRIPQRYSGHHFAIELVILMNALEKQGLCEATHAELEWGHLEGMVATRDAWNLLVDNIRADIQSPVYKDFQKRHTKGSAKNQKSAQRWLDHLRSHRSRLLFLRLDLHYDKRFELHSGDMHAVTLTEIFTHREQFLRRLPRWIQFDALLGYLCKTEYKFKRNIHHHFLIAVDGHKLREGGSLNALLGTKWKALTNGRGSYFNVNAQSSDRPENCGIGNVDVRDEQKVFNLRHRVIPYLSKPDPYIRWVVPKRHRLFLKSVALPLIGPKPGRPRNSAQVSNFGGPVPPQEDSHEA
jgi:hypothetical protein